MDITKLKTTIIDNPHYIESILESLELFKIRDYGLEYRCAKYHDGSPTGICVKKDTLKYFYRGRDGEDNGDIFTLVQGYKNISFYDAIKFICHSTGIDVEQFDKSDKVEILPFGGYFSGLKKNDGDFYEEITTYPENILNDYELMPSKRFIKDGINVKVQHDFKIGYDYFSDRVIVPWRNSTGEIVGIMGRINDDVYEEKDLAKWFPLVKFPKSQVLFGLYENYKTIQETRLMIVGESEKFPMQMLSMENLVDKPLYKDGKIVSKQRYEGYGYGVSVGGHSISNVQKKLIQSCFPDTVIIAFDNDIEEDYLIETAKKLQFNNHFFKMNVGYIFDEKGLYLPKNSKASPTDFGKEVFDKLMCNCVKFI